MRWVVTVPLWRAGKAVPIAERLEQLEAFHKLTSGAVRFETEEQADSAAYLWSQALGFRVEARLRPPLPSPEEAERLAREGETEVPID